MFSNGGPRVRFLTLEWVDKSGRKGRKVIKSGPVPLGRDPEEKKNSWVET